jgi:hypothetical protein
MKWDSNIHKTKTRNTNPLFTQRRRLHYDQKLAENVADRDKSQEKRPVVESS